jgi:hypothetical protein
MRSLLSAILLSAAAGAFGATLDVSSAAAQSGYVHHNYCLLTGPARECAYETFAQCQAAKRGNADFCEPNDEPLNHPHPRYQVQ